MTAASPSPSQDPAPSTSPHMAVFGHLFELPVRAREVLGSGTRVTAFVQRSRLTGTDGLEHADAVIALPDDAPHEEWAAAARALHAARPFTHGAALADHLLAEAAHVLGELGVPFHSPRTVRNVLDKRSMRDALALASGTDGHVAHRHASDAATARQAVREVGLPCVVKPSSGTGSHGAVVVRDEAEVGAAAAQAAAVAPGILVEHFVAGPQYSVEAVSEGGEHVVLAVTRKFSDPGSLVELGHVLPAPLSDADRTAVEECAARVLDAVGLEFGPSHTEVILGADGPVPIETHARVGGDDIWLMVHAATGVDLDEVQADQSCGRKVLPGVRRTLEGSRGRERHQAIWFGVAAEEGRFDGLKPAAESETGGFPDTEVSELAAVGGPMRPLASSDDRVFQVRASGDSAQEALDRARRTAAAVAAANGLDVGSTSLDATF